MSRALLRTILAVVVLCVFFAAVAWAHVGTGIAVDRGGRIYFADTVHNRIWKIDGEGKQSLVAGGIHTDLLVVDDDGNLYVQNDRPSPEAPGGLLKITSEGRVTPALGLAEMERGVGQPFTVDRHGNIYFYQGDPQRKRGVRIFKRTPQGQVSLVARSDEKIGRASCRERV